MSELTKEKIYKKELEKVGAEGNNNLERIRSLGGGGGTTVVANPELSGDEANLTGLQVGNTKYAVPQGSGLTLYEHQISFNDSDGTANVTFYITTTSNTQFTVQTLKSYLTDWGAICSGSWINAQEENVLITFIEYATALSGFALYNNVAEGYVVSFADVNVTVEDTVRAVL